MKVKKKIIDLKIIAVCTYPCDETLTGKDWRTTKVCGYIIYCN
uniref:Orphan protein n=1 Tax=Heterorhabditis bacteriophora TaxID=37862 RepID=A0A1I7WK04_HETBA